MERYFAPGMPAGYPLRRAVSARGVLRGVDQRELQPGGGHPVRGVGGGAGPVRRGPVAEVVPGAAR